MAAIFGRKNMYTILQYGPTHNTRRSLPVDDELLKF